ncbi:MAG: hypothetical protein AAF349_20960 [Cyanobacteria bacterium P01_A01_bin.68]
MSSTVRLPSGKLINLSRFVALFDDDNSRNNYRLSLDGLNQELNIDAEDAEFIMQKLELKSDVNSYHVKQEWDKAAQLHQNQPLMELIEKWKQEKQGKITTEEEVQEYNDIQESLKRNRFTE